MSNLSSLSGVTSTGSTSALGPVVQLSGLASGMDTTSIVQELVAADSGTLNQLQAKSANISSAESTISSIGSGLASLQTAAQALSDATTNGAYTGTSSDASIGITATGTATPGTYAINVSQLANAQRTYSASFATQDQALGQTGSFSIQVGSGSSAVTKTVNVTSTDSLQSIVGKINDSGARVGASVFYDGTNYRLQIRGLDTGAANALTFTESGTSLDLNGDGSSPTGGKTVQTATDAQLSIDGFDVTSPSNTVTNALQGVSLSLTSTTATPATVSIATNATQLAQNITSVVNAYNQVVSMVHTATGYGTFAAQNPLLASDSSLRSVTDRLTEVMSESSGSGTYTLLSQIGLTLNDDGTVALDSTKLTTALATDPQSVENLLGRQRNAATGGTMADLSDLVDQTTLPGGTLANETSAFQQEATSNNSSISNEQDRLTQYQTQLQAQFSNMETIYSQNQSLLSQVEKIA